MLVKSIIDKFFFKNPQGLTLRGLAVGFILPEVV